MLEIPAKSFDRRALVCLNIFKYPSLRFMSFYFIEVVLYGATINEYIEFFARIKSELVKWYVK